MSKNPKERIKELRTLLHHYNVEYYVHSRSLISDFEFDHLMKELEELEEKYPVFYDENSPSKRVGEKLQIFSKSCSRISYAIFIK